MEVPQHKIRISQIDFIRAYAFTNRLELISVLIELFFEKEAIFKQYYPDLFMQVGGMIKHPKTK